MPLALARVDIKLKHGDTLLLNSDGLHGYVPEAAYGAVRGQQGPAKDRADALVGTAPRFRTGDNVTVGVIQID